MPPDPTLFKYKCHKTVVAGKITAIIDPSPPEQETDGRRELHFDGVDGTLLVSHAYMVKHKPEVGGYFVLYEDGYQSFSPAKVFEDGYTRIQ